MNSPSATPGSAQRSLRPVRARSQATHDALLAGARKLLASKGLDDLSIAEIAASNHMSVGSFYGRFQDKEAFFGVLQDTVTAEWKAAATEVLEACRVRADPAQIVVREVCRLVVRTMHADAGFVRAAVKHASTQPLARTPAQEAGIFVVDAVVQTLEPLLHALRPGERAARTRVAMQIVYGTCVNAVLHDPGPLLLKGPKLEHELSRIVCLYLGLDPAGIPPLRLASTKGRP